LGEVPDVSETLQPWPEPTSIPWLPPHPDGTVPSLRLNA
jgi:hypothetical protein